MLLLSADLSQCKTVNSCCFKLLSLWLLYGNKRKLIWLLCGGTGGIAEVLNLGRLWPTTDNCQCLKTSLVVTTEVVTLASSGHRPGKWLNTIQCTQCTNSPHNKESYSPKCQEGCVGKPCWQAWKAETRRLVRKWLCEMVGVETRIMTVGLEKSGQFLECSGNKWQNIS